MEIYVVKGVGKGETTLSAYDSALEKAGVYNYNLITLSSIIPPGVSIVEVDRFNSPPEEYGNKLYVIKAEIRSHETGKYIAAGLGWYQLQEDGRGVFVEHETIRDTRPAVEAEINYKIRTSLKDLCDTRGFNYADNLRSSVAITRIGDKPACVLAIAVYQSESWG